MVPVQAKIASYHFQVDQLVAIVITMSDRDAVVPAPRPMVAKGCPAARRGASRRDHALVRERL